MHHPPPNNKGKSFLTEELENEAARLNLKVFFAAARSQGPLSLDAAIALCERANKEFSRGSSK